MNNTQRGCFFTLGIIVIGFFTINYLMFGDRSFYRAGLNHYEHAPSEASDINVYHQSNIAGMFLCDFNIDETNFVQFANKYDWKLMEITNSVSVFLASSFNKKRPNDRKFITHGLIYSKRQSNGGGVTLVYDRESHRGYIDSSKR